MGWDQHKLGEHLFKDRWRKSIVIRCQERREAQEWDGWSWVLGGLGENVQIFD